MQAGAVVCLRSNLAPKPAWSSRITFRPELPTQTMDSESVVSQVQRKIELQSPEDLTYLITNVRNAAAARLNEAFPHVEGHEGEDDLRNQIEALVNEVFHLGLPLFPPWEGKKETKATATSGRRGKELTKPFLPVHRQDIHIRRAKPLHKRPPHRPRHLPPEQPLPRHCPRAVRHAQAPACRRAHHPGGEAPRGGRQPEALGARQGRGRARRGPARESPA